MIKFRTLIKSVKNVSKGTKEFLTSQNGNNTTAFTSFLRRTGLDELPQLFHVAAGKMKIVGPRPLMISDIKVIEKQYPEFYSFRNSMKLRPGITGLWQLYGQKDSGIEDLSKFDINYYTTNSFIKDLKIIGITFRYMMKAAKK